MTGWGMVTDKNRVEEIYTKLTTDRSARPREWSIELPAFAQKDRSRRGSLQGAPRSLVKALSFRLRFFIVAIL